MQGNTHAQATSASTSYHNASPRPRRLGSASKLATVVGATMGLSSCVWTHENLDWVDWNDLDFQGYSQNPSATIQIQAFNKQSNSWVPVATATSSNSASSLGGDELYSWSKLNFDFTTIPSWACYWGSGTSCNIPPGSASAKFRFKELGSDLNYLYTFDDGGATCVLDEIRDGKSWLAAGLLCSSDDSPVLTLRVLT